MGDSDSDDVVRPNKRRRRNGKQVAATQEIESSPRHSSGLSQAAPVVRAVEASDSTHRPRRRLQLRRAPARSAPAAGEGRTENRGGGRRLRDLKPVVYFPEEFEEFMSEDDEESEPEADEQSESENHLEGDFGGQEHENTDLSRRANSGPEPAGILVSTQGREDSQLPARGVTLSEFLAQNGINEDDLSSATDSGEDIPYEDPRYPRLTDPQPSTSVVNRAETERNGRHGNIDLPNKRPSEAKKEGILRRGDNPKHLDDEG